MGRVCDEAWKGILAKFLIPFESQAEVVRLRVATRIMGAVERGECDPQQLKIIGLQAINRLGYAMQPNTTALERAFELTKSGKCRSIEEIKSRLSAEGYWSDVIEGRRLVQQLRALMETARERRVG